MLKGLKVKIYPTKEQEEILFIYCKYFHIMRNFLVGKFKDNLPNVNTYGISNYKEIDLIEDFGETDIPLPSRLVKGVLKSYQCALIRFYKGTTNAKPPKFHKYNPNKKSFYLPSREYSIKNYCVPFPHNKKFSIKGKSKIKIDSFYIEKFGVRKIKELRFVYENKRWFLTGSYEIEEPKKKESIFIGLDWGIKNFMTTSNGIFINYPKTINREFYRINKLQSIRDKKIRNSKNWIKINNKIIKAYNRLENLKRNFIEQTTTNLCKDYSVAIEDLTNAKIRISNKSRRRIKMINPLSRFTKSLEWKCRKFGTLFVKVNPAYTTQKCCYCGNIMNLSLKDRICNCSCGNHMNRDINAAINIAARATCNSF